MSSPQQFKRSVWFYFYLQRFFTPGAETKTPSWGWSGPFIFITLMAVFGLILMPSDNVPSTPGETLVASSSLTSPLKAGAINKSAGLVSEATNGDWRARFSQRLTDYEYLPGENASGLQAPNRAHNLRTYFAAEGIRVFDRTAAGSPVLLGLSLARLGRVDALTPVKLGNVEYTNDRVEIHRPGLIEWYQNSSQGLEQGFTLPKRIQGKDALVLELAVEHATAAMTGQSVELTTDQGRRLRYGKLKTIDANGRVLFSRFTVPSPDRVHLVINDSGAVYPLVIDPLLTAVQDALLESNQLGSSGIKPSAFGVSVSGAGDVNGDGFADVIVGAWGWDGGENEEGAAFVFLGSAAGIVGADPATAFARIESNNAAARLGRSVSSAGDVNGDGFDDIVVGAYLYRSSVFFEGFGLGTVQGAAFVYLGSATGIQGANDPAQANARIISNEIDSFLGYSVSDAGDVNGDGFADILVGGPRAGIPFSEPTIPPYDRQGNGGVALMFLGSAAGITGTGFEDADKELRPYPPGLPQLLGGGMGGSVSGAGDVNGDGFADIVVGMTGSGGSVMVFLGSATGIVGDDPTSAHANIFSDAITPLGDSVSGAGDVNSDGFDDIILGAPRSPIPAVGFSAEQLGAVLVFHGSLAGITATSAADAQVMFEGVMASNQLGWEVAAAGDVDGDGFDDVIVAALAYAGSLDQEGAAYVFRGSPLGIVGTSLRDDAYVRLESRQSRAVINTVDIALSASGVGDINGDGFADVMLGSGFYDSGELNEGAAFVYHGQSAPINPNQPPVPVAGADQVYVDIDDNGVETITVDGNLSFDPDGFITSYEWREGEVLLGTSPRLTTALPTTGDHGLVLVVTDDAGISRGDPVVVRVGLVDKTLAFFDDFSGGLNWTTTGDVTLGSESFPTPPQVRLGASGASLSRAITLPAGATGMTLQFWGKASQFGLSDQVKVQVSRDGGPFTTIKTFTVLDSDNAYHFYGGTVGDGRLTFSWYPDTAATMVLRFESTTTTGFFTVDDIRVFALQAPTGLPLPPAGQLPVANAGVNIMVDDNDTDGFELVNLDGRLSSDTDGSIVSYQWFEQTSSGTVLLGTGSVLGVSFGHGDHNLRLIVTDNNGGSSADTVVVTVNQVFPDNLAPVANAGLDQTIIDVDGNTLEVVTFDGTFSTDLDGAITAYIWRKNGTPLGNTANFSVTLPIGVHTVDLTVTDNLGASSTDTVVVTVVPSDPNPTIVSFFATPASITAGEFANLVWSLSGTVTATIDNGIGDIGLTGSRLVNPTTTTTYTLTATGTGGTATSSVTLTVGSAPPPVPDPPTVDSFSSAPGSITTGGSATLSWTTTGADSVSIDNGVGTIAVDGSITVNPSVTTTYTLTATGTGGTTAAGITVTVNPAPPRLPTVDSFAAAPGSITAGGSATLSWTTTDADSVSIDNGVGAVAVDGSITVTPAATTTYTLTATGPGGSVTASQTVSVQAASAETLTITSWEFRADKDEWRIEGSSSIPGPGNTMTLYVGSTVAGSPVLGTANVDNAGDWSFRGENSAANPDASGTLSIQSSQGGTWEGISGTGTATPGSGPPPPPSLPSVDSFSAAPASITVGDNSILTWSSTNATSVSINGGASLPAEGSSTVSPIETTTYTLTAIGAGGTASSSVTVTVNPAPILPPTVDSFSASPATITEGESTTLSWTTTDATSVSIDNGVGTGLAADGSVTLSPVTSTSYTLTATGVGGTAGASITVTVNPAPTLPPTVDSFAATPATITEGESTTLSWTTTDATSVSIDNGVGTGLPADGNVTVSPVTSTNYTLTATGAGGTASASITVTVNPATAETINVSKAQFRASKAEWRIQGTSSVAGPGNSVTIYIGPTATGTVLGTAAVNSLGTWSFRERDSAFTPDATGTFSLQSSNGGLLEGINISLK